MTKLFVLPAAFGLLIHFPVGRTYAGDPETVPGVSLSVQAYGIAEADMDGCDAAYAVSGSTLALDWAHWQFSAARHFYQWDTPASFPGMTGTGDPWEFFTRLQLGYQHSHTLSDRWSLETLAGVLSDFEEELDDSWAAYLGGYGSYRAGEDWLWFVGLLTSHHAEIDSDFEWVPVLGLAWRPAATDGLSLRLPVQPPPRKLRPPPRRRPHR